MGHDIDIINLTSGITIEHTYITFNFSKYAEKYPGVNAIHGHKNSTVIKILIKTINLLLNDGIVPRIYEPGGRALTFGDSDPHKDLQCYAACLLEFLYIAFEIKKDTDGYYLDGENHENVYWFSDQVWEITKFISLDGYESDGIERPKRKITQSITQTITS